ncbi:unnamed protein product [Cuscuta europaea]|uniref:FAR1 domain-containing protein n=1 Tax=Cuscuta europaea TaxID=41803 RepID=A0A9P1E6P1_CUSEU|nr:unnamed protein product [Cuscuta europaea]
MKLVQWLLYKLLHLLSRDTFATIDKATENKSLVGLCVKSEKDAYNLYNSHAFENGFGIRRCKQRFRSGNVSLIMKSYCCWKEGKKLQKGTENKMYTKLDYRSGCKAKLQFSISVDGEWTVSKHITDHNHSFCPIGQRPLLKSHRGVDHEYLEFIMLMKESGTKVSDIHRMLQK